MIFKSLFTFRKVAPERGQADEAGMIVIMMMALVFIPIILAHAAVMWPTAAATQQLVGLFDVIVKTF